MSSAEKACKEPLVTESVLICIISRFFPILFKWMLIIMILFFQNYPYIIINIHVSLSILAFIHYRYFIYIISLSHDMLHVSNSWHKQRLQKCCLVGSTCHIDFIHGQHFLFGDSNCMWCMISCFKQYAKKKRKIIHLTVIALFSPGICQHAVISTIWDSGNFAEASTLSMFLPD